MSPAETEEEGRKAVETKKALEEKQDNTSPEKSVNADISISITKLGLPTRIMNCFLSIGMRTAKDLLEVPDKEALLAIPGIGKGTYEKVLANLERQGFDTRHLRW